MRPPTSVDEPAAGKAAPTGNAPKAAKAGHAARAGNPSKVGKSPGAAPREALASLSERLPFPPPAPRAAGHGPWSRRRRNRRATEPVAWSTTVKNVLWMVGRQLLFAFKLALAGAAIVAALLAGRAGLDHLVRSPRFALREIAISPTAHASRDLVLAVAGVALGDQLLTVDIERIQRRLLRLPWVASVQVRRSLPSTLVIDLAERTAAATALIGGLYLVDEGGHPFKKASSAEAAELVTLTGLGRGLFVAAAEPAEAALRQALGLLRIYQAPTDNGRPRPPLSEIRIDARAGFTLVLLQGGTEIALGHGDWPARLARFDLLTDTLGADALAELRQVHLDGPNLSRIPVLPRPPAPDDADVAAAAPLPGKAPATARSREAVRAVAMKAQAAGPEGGEGKP